MAYIITRETTNGTKTTQTIASLRKPELVAEIIQELNRTIPADGAHRVARSLLANKSGSFGADSFTAEEV